MPTISAAMAVTVLLGLGIPGFGAVATFEYVEVKQEVAENTDARLLQERKAAEQKLTSFLVLQDEYQRNGKPVPQFVKDGIRDASAWKAAVEAELKKRGVTKFY